MPSMRRLLLVAALATAIVLPPSVAAQVAAPGPQRVADAAPAREADDGTFPTTASKVAMRAAPDGKLLRRLPKGTEVRIVCQRNGPLASAPVGRTRVWDRVVVDGRRGWVSDGYVDTETSGLVAPMCGVGTPPADQVEEGRCGPSSPFDLLPPFARAEDLVTAALPAARESRTRFGVPVSVTIAQSILETGGGKVAALANNYFGLKAQEVGKRTWRWEDIAGGCVFKKTREVRDGRSATEIAAFRAYRSLSDSIVDHGRRLATNPAYEKAFAHADEPRRFAKEIARRYATDPRYARKLLALMDRYDLGDHDG